MPHGCIPWRAPRHRAIVGATKNPDAHVTFGQCHFVLSLEQPETKGPDMAARIKTSAEYRRLFNR